MAWDVAMHEEVDEWLCALDDDLHAKAVAVLELLQENGPQLGRPYVDTLSGSEVKNLKEIRVGGKDGRGKRCELRVLFAFDPKKSAILLVAGDKANTQNAKWNKWYRIHIPIAEKRFENHIKALNQTP